MVFRLMFVQGIIRSVKVRNYSLFMTLQKESFRCKPLKNMVLSLRKVRMQLIKIQTLKHCPGIAVCSASCPGQQRCVQVPELGGKYTSASLPR